MSIEPKLSGRSTTGARPEEVVDSWDAEDSDDVISPLASTPTVVKSRPPPQLSDYPSAPPPTPVAPQQWQHQGSRFQDIDFNKDLGGSSTKGRGASSASPDARPEKTNAVAGRLIAGALGVKAPRRTEEQRAYDKAMKEKESKKKETERERKRLDEERKARTKKEIWDS